MYLGDQLDVSQEGAAEEVAMAVDVLGQRMQHDVRAMQQGSLQSRRGEGAVHEDEKTRRVGTCCDGRDIEDVPRRIHWCFEIDCPAARRYHSIQIGWIVEVDRNYVDAEARQSLFGHRGRVGIQRPVYDQLIAL